MQECSERAMEASREHIPPMLSLSGCSVLAGGGCDPSRASPEAGPFLRGDSSPWGHLQLHSPSTGNGHCWFTPGAEV